MESLPLAHSMTWEVMAPNLTATFRPPPGWYWPDLEREFLSTNMSDSNMQSTFNSTYLDNYYLNMECTCDASLCQHRMMPMNDPSSMRYPWKSNPHFYPNILTYVATLLLGVTGNIAVIVVMRGVWWCVLVCGHVWWCVVVCGGVWSCVVVCGCVWWCVVVCGGVWLCVVVCGHVWWCVLVCGGVRCVVVVVKLVFHSPRVNN
ncbi:hypothetical protein FHG87_006728 [Trinorchestia longiramus]|nr:hypothetical protein FHG87_006728 [Trinorchestia longiramus]